MSRTPQFRRLARAGGLGHSWPEAAGLPRLGPIGSKPSRQPTCAEFLRSQGALGPLDRPICVIFEKVRQVPMTAGRGSGTIDTNFRIYVVFASHKTHLGLLGALITTYIP